MSTSYTFSIIDDFNNSEDVDLITLEKTINENVTLSTVVDYCLRSLDSVDIFFTSPLSSAQETVLTNIVNSYTYVKHTEPIVLTNIVAIDSSNVICASQLTTYTGCVTLGDSPAPIAGQALISSDPTTASWQNLPISYEYTYSEDLVTSSTTSESYISKLIMTTASVPTGDYKISWSFDATCGDSKGRFNVEVDLDNGDTLHTIETEPIKKDLYLTFSSFAKRTLSAGVHVIKINYKTNYRDDVVYIKNTKIELYRIA